MAEIVGRYQLHGIVESSDNVTATWDSSYYYRHVIVETNDM